MKTMRRRLGVAFAGILVCAGAWVSLSSAPTAAGFVSIREGAFQRPELLTRAWALPAASRYFQPVVSQTNPSACGPTSVANILGSWGVSTTADQVAAHGKGCWAGICFGGLTLNQLADAASATTKLKVTVVHPPSVEALREELAHANEPNTRYSVNFHRGPLFGTGGGHHSPVGGFLAADDLVFVLDVNASYGPWLVSTARLFEAMDTQDTSSGEKRGLIKFEQQ